MEITYNTGAKVLLEGPVTYQVESNGGYLSVGKLTGKLEKKAEGGRRKAEETDNQKFPFPLPPSPFVVRTPTATVTDLGTEFGVEVTADQRNRVQVFQGKVVVETRGPTAETSRTVELCEGEWASVEPHGVLTRYSGRQAQTAAGAIGFVRKIPRRIIKNLESGRRRRRRRWFWPRAQSGYQSEHGRNRDSSTDIRSRLGANP